MNQNSLHKLLTISKDNTLDKDNLDSLFDLRLATNITLIKNLYFSLYPEEKHSKDFDKLLKLLTVLFNARPADLKKQDITRIKEGNWYQSENIVGMQMYVDHFNKDINGLTNKLAYFENLGVNFLHLMPITTRPKKENDGGYAVNSYTEVDKKYGTKKELLNLTTELRSKKMYLMLDFVVNHTSDEFSWAKKASKGEQKYQDYYYTYANRDVPDAFEQSLPEVFPTTAPGNFTYNDEMQKWVMTVFNSYQWDLNYTNPEVFVEMLTNLVKLSNLGVDVVRFDALAFLWKKIGTNSQNLPEAHALIGLFRMCLQVIAPGVIILAEAIVAPTDVLKYFGEKEMEGNECEVAYNATLMALLWDSIATTKTQLLTKTLNGVPQKPNDATWINYIRCHDDIGLGFDDKDIYQLGLDAKQHRWFLLDYYCQKLEWSPAKGSLFMYNPKNGDGRITGSAASLLGLEFGLEKNDSFIIQTAIKKIKMMHSIILSYGGIPMIYAGDEIATLNDYSYKKDNNKKDDSRWVNRPNQDWEVIKKLNNKTTPQSEIFYAVKQLIAIRKKTPAFADHNNTILHEHSNPHLLIYERLFNNQRILVLCNFDLKNHSILKNWLAEIDFEIDSKSTNLITNTPIALQNNALSIAPYEAYWILK
jgi:amylosucrase